MASVTLQICRNDNFKDCRIIQVNADNKFWKNVLQQGKNKLKMSKATRVFGVNGKEYDLTTKGAPPDLLSQGIPGSDATKLIISSGKDFNGVVREDNPLRQDPSTVDVRLLAKDSLVEKEAIKQLHYVARLAGVKVVVGMPDLHQGRDYPIGAAIASEGVFYPHLVGNDVGCGMLLAETALLSHKRKSLDKMAAKLRDLEFGYTEFDKRKGAVDNSDSIPLYLRQFQAVNTDYDHQLGSIGGGNHFAELQEVEHVYDKDTFSQLGMDEQKLYLLVHSGSRGLGASIFNSHLTQHGPTSLTVGSDEALQYLRKHDNAVNWAKANRKLIADRFCSMIASTCCRSVLDITHNSVIRKPWESGNQTMVKELQQNANTVTDDDLEPDTPETPTTTTTTTTTGTDKHQQDEVAEEPKSEESSCGDPEDDQNSNVGDDNLFERFNNDSNQTEPNSAQQKDDEDSSCSMPIFWLHRKGAAPADKGVVVIPGSRGHRSYVVKPVESSGEACGYSLAHGAGRRWGRVHALQHAQGKGLQPSAFATTKLGSKVICADKNLVFEEAPEAYKDIDEIIEDLVKRDVVSVVAILKPLITYKTRTMGS